jgi:hypothetical protein
MGGGGGPTIIIVPEEDIQDTLQNGKDYTLKENEKSTFTTDLTVPPGTTLTIKGTLDLGDGNTLKVKGALVINGGSITNEDSNVFVFPNGTIEMKNGGEMVISGNLELDDTSNLVIDLTAADSKIEVNTLLIKDNASVTIVPGVSGSVLDLILGGSVFTDAQALKSTILNIKPEGNLTIEAGSSLTLDDKSYLVLGEDATMNCEGTLTLSCNPRANEGDAITPKFSIENKGEINVTGGGTIIGSTETETIIGTGKILVKGTAPPPGGAQSTIQNVSIKNNDIEVGEESLVASLASFGKIILGEAGDDWFDTLSSSVIGLVNSSGIDPEYATPGGISFTTGANVKIYSAKGIVYLNPSSEDSPSDNYVGIQYNNGGVKSFPDGTETLEGSISTFPSANNPGFDIPYDSFEGESGPCVNRLDKLNDTASKVIAIKD